MQFACDDAGFGRAAVHEFYESPRRHQSTAPAEVAAALTKKVHTAYSPTLHTSMHTRMHAIHWWYTRDMSSSCVQASHFFSTLPTTTMNDDDVEARDIKLRNLQINFVVRDEL